MKISPAVFRALAIVWTIIILIGCLVPQADIPGPLVSINDKAMHALIFAPFAFLWIQAGFRLLPVLLAGCLFGA